MNRLLLALPVLLATLASAQQLTQGRVLVAGGISAVLMPLNPPPPSVGPLTMPDQFQVYGMMVSVCSPDASVDGFLISVRVETASGARIDFTGVAKWDKISDWSTQVFYTAKDPVVKVLKLSVIPLQPNQVKTFEPEP
jgi:hypothetical protein